MASRAAIATMNDLAFKRLYRAMADISEAFPDVEPATLPSFRDIRYQEAARYDALASWSERLAVAMGVSSVPEIVEEVEKPESETQTIHVEDVEIIEDEMDTDERPFDTNSDYGQYSNRELRALANERGVPIDGLRSKAELIDALEAADGLTEDEQAAKHAGDTQDEAAS